MARLAAFFFFCLTFAVLPAASPLLLIDNVQLPSPAGVGAHTPQFTHANGSALLSFVQPGPDNTPALYFSSYDAKARSWNEPSFAGSTDPRPSPTSNTHSQPPTIVNNSGRVASAWFVADARDPRVLLSLSPDAGGHFLMPLHVEDTKPIGAPDLVLLADGTVFISWPELANQDETTVWIRRISPGGELSVPVLLATLPTNHAAPKLALVKDYDATSAQLLLTYAVGEGDASQIITRLLTITIPTAGDAKPCNCPGDETARGYALKGRVTAINSARKTLTVKHEEISGVLQSGTNEFKTEPAALKFATVGNEVYARIEKRDGQWWLFGARLIMRP